MSILTIKSVIYHKKTVPLGTELKYRLFNFIFITFLSFKQNNFFNTLLIHKDIQNVIKSLLFKTYFCHNFNLYD